MLLSIITVYICLLSKFCKGREKGRFFLLSVQGQTGWGFEQPVLVGGAPAHARGLELDGL